MQSKSTEAGFTLIEIMVVLMLLAMISGVLFQALERSYRLQERFGTELFDVQRASMTSDWFRQDVQGLYPDYADGPDIFRGKASEFSGLSTNPLIGQPGAPTRIGWKLRPAADARITELVYLHGTQEMVLSTWQTAESRFSYLDAALVAHDQWPPPLGLYPQLPRQIQLQAAMNGERIALPVTILGPPAPPPRVKDILGQQE